MSGLHNGLLLDAYTVFSTGRFRNQNEEYSKFCMRANLWVGLALALVYIILAQIIFRVRTEGWSGTTLVLAAVTPVFLTSLYLRRVFYARNESVKAGKISMAYFAVVMIFQILLIQYQKISETKALVALGIGWLVVGLLIKKDIFNLLARPKFNVNPIQYIREHWAYSKWVLMTAAIVQLVGQGYLWLIAYYLPIEEVASFRAALNIVLPVNVALSALSMINLPKLSNMNHSKDYLKFRGFTKEYLTINIFVSLLFVVSVSFAGSQMLDFFYKGKYSHLDHLLTILSFSTIAHSVAAVFNDAVKAFEKSDYIFYAYLTGAIITISTGPYLITRYGIEGASWGMVISATGYALILVVLGILILKRRCNSISPRCA